jgi:hypothetical protein
MAQLVISEKLLAENCRQASDFSEEAVGIDGGASGSLATFTSRAILPATTFASSATRAPLMKLLTGGNSDWSA